MGKLTQAARSFILVESHVAASTTSSACSACSPLVLENGGREKQLAVWSNLLTSTRLKEAQRTTTTRSELDRHICG